MRRVLKALFLVVPLLLIVLAAAVPMPLRWSVAGMIFGLLFFELALVGSFEGMLPNTRVYLALREETDRLLQLVRELNAATIDAERAGLDPKRYADPIVAEMHETVDRLPSFAGRSADGHLHLTPLAGHDPETWEEELH